MQGLLITELEVLFPIDRTVFKAISDGSDAAYNRMMLEYASTLAMFHMQERLLNVLPFQQLPIHTP
ncbi:hypothetical protein COY90_05075 [Candidatus Roizmanbacteria bacterium CG_4_10_14_0_8_um_filter_39_9]|uniref:Uncharacterized protein n=1 Tax=Candidatus Roizmanbacteria bacterium CG_4_10_14_0_8_um_filter_39_9 TaxID=1974829 RepID=A0A2M7QBJ3_9BACT|nr:MAG: hypothetical protein COY90_05075 [Candidatus Roizmanbacteria bacterium CG_4_10_14_0_8_um_filter_39_9]